MARAALTRGSTLVVAVLSAVTPASASSTAPQSGTHFTRDVATGAAGASVTTADATTDPGTTAHMWYWTGRTLLVSGAAIGGLGASLLAIEPFADGTPFVGVGLGALAIGGVATGIGLPLWLANRTSLAVRPEPLARGLSITGRF